MSRLMSNIKHRVKENLILKNGYIKQRYWEYYALHSGNDLGSKIRRMLKVAELNIECKRNQYFPGKENVLPEPRKLAAQLEKYEIISFDVFDTLLLRKVEKPTDVFLYMEAKYQFPRFSYQRVRAEAEARKKSLMGEVSLDDIYEILARWINVDAECWKEREMLAERTLCYANPYMKELIKELLIMGKRIIAVSDMYLSGEAVGQLLTDAGYSGIEKLFLSNEFQASKGNGELYEVVKGWADTNNIVHIGDNIVSDCVNARKAGLESFYYPNVNAQYGVNNLLYGMSNLTGAFTKGIINAYLNNGMNKVTPYFEYGMMNGGLLACGYCEFLNKVVKEKGIDKILFVARDGYIVKKVYNAFYDECANDYILFSRFCSEQILFEKYTEDYIHHNFYFRLGLEKKVSLEQLLQEIDLEFLIEKLSEYNLKKEELYTSANSDRVVDFIYQEKEAIIRYFKATQDNMYAYLKPMIEGYKKILVVDLGWFGTGGLAVKFLLEEKFGRDVEVISALVGTNQDPSLESRIARGDLQPYAYSPVHNLYLLHWHTSHQYNIHNLLIELLFSAPQPSFLKFEKLENGKIISKYGYDEKENYDIMNEMHQGIMKFAEIYNSLDSEIKSMLQIGGGDAYAAFMCTADDHKKCYDMFKDYKISHLSGIFGSETITTMGQIMKEDGYI